LKQAFHTISVSTRGPGLTEFTDDAAQFVRGAGVEDGLLTCFIRPRFRHTTEGPDDMPSHIRSALTQTSIGIPLCKGRLALGTWQGIYVFEHRDAPHRREVMLHVIGE
jgi:thiamine phosphate synthase YjbQ (UPF0047 family)